MAVTMTRNEDKNGIELHFSEKPAVDVLEQLKANGFRYHRQGRFWYARHTTPREALALSLTNHETSEPQSQSSQTTTETFFPSYDIVDDTRIFHSAADVSICDARKGYFADIKAMIIARNDHVRIIDLTNALVPGLKCTRITAQTDQLDLLMGCSSFQDVYTRYFIERAAPERGELFVSEDDSKRTFTPFKCIPPIKKPAKWTLPHIWKGILSGQIYTGRIDQRLTDDYAYDAHVNFLEGRSVHLPSFAKDIIESPGGWSAYPDRETDGIVQLSVNCHSFDLRTLFFDEKCNWEESNRREVAQADELEQHNQGLLAQALIINEDDLPADSCYAIAYIDMDYNTKRYEIKEKIITRWAIDEGEYHGCPIIAYEKHELTENQLYWIEGAAEQTIELDERIISMEVGQYAITGKALSEMLAEGIHFSAISMCYLSIDEAERDLRDHICGRIMIMFGPKADYERSLNRLIVEKARVA